MLHNAKHETFFQNQTKYRTLIWTSCNIHFKLPKCDTCEVRDSLNESILNYTKLQDDQQTPSLPEILHHVRALNFAETVSNSRHRSSMKPSWNIQIWWVFKSDSREKRQMGQHKSVKHFPLILWSRPLYSAVFNSSFLLASVNCMVLSSSHVTILCAQYCRVHFKVI